MGSPLTLKELAALLHLAPSTVSRALKGHPDISKSTQERVNEMAQRLHYQPDALAKSFREKNTYTIAVLVPQLKDFFCQVVSVVLELAWQRKYKVMVFESREEEEQEIRICRFLEKSGIVGLLAAPALNVRTTDHYHRLMSAGLPVIIFGRILGNLDSDRVLGDYFKGAYEAVSYMIDGGCRRIAHLSGPKFQIWAQKRQMGYAQALMDHHLPIDTELMFEYPSLELEQVVYRWVYHLGIDGIFAVEDEVALEVLKVLKKMKCRVPQDIAVCGYGNSRIGEYSCPSLTSVDETAEVMALNCMDLLWKRIDGEKSDHTETRYLKNKLIARESTRTIVIENDLF